MKRNNYSYIAGTIPSRNRGLMELLNKAVLRCKGTRAQRIKKKSEKNN